MKQEKKWCAVLLTLSLFFSIVMAGCEGGSSGPGGGSGGPGGGSGGPGGESDGPGGESDGPGGASDASGSNGDESDGGEGAEIAEGIVATVRIAGAPDGSLVTAGLEHFVQRGKRLPTIEGLEQFNPTTGKVTPIVPIGCSKRDIITNIVVAADGSILALKEFFIIDDPESQTYTRLIRIDATTYKCTSVSDATKGRERGTGPALDGAGALAVAVDGSVFVGVPGAVLRVDPVTGDRTLVTGTATRKGSGPALINNFPTVAVAVDGSVFIGVRGSGLAPGPGNIAGTVLRVDPITGDRTFVASTKGQPLVAVAADGSLFITDDSSSAIVYRLDLVGGKFTLVTDAFTGRGPDLDGAGALVVAVDGSVFVGVPGAVLRVDPVTRNREVILGEIGGGFLGFLEIE